MEDQLDPHQSERVRRMLADARHSDPMPAAVAARLDTVLADLALEDADGPAEGTNVVPLADRRRRAGGLLLAAAAVVVAGVAVGQVLGSGGAEDSQSAGLSDTALEAPERGVTPQPTEGDDDPGSGAVVQSQRSLADVRPLRVRPDQFSQDARRARQAAVTALRGADAEREEGRGARDGFDRRSFAALGCEPGLWGGGRYVPVDYARTSAWLVLRPPRGDTQVVDLFVCGEDAPERSTTLRFR